MSAAGPPGLSGVAQRVARIQERIAAACRRAGRNPGEVTLIAASKTQPLEAIRAAAAAGVKVFGENRVQEAAAKVEALPHLSWHMIGTLQRNKARRACCLFELIHSVDSLELALALARLGEERGRPIEALLEVNIAFEGTKSGLSPEEVLENLRRLKDVPGLVLRGLMSIPPPVGNPEESRGYFRALRRLAEEAARLDLLRAGVPELSMGMSDDFEIAIQEGATMVRVGTALFGPRPRPAIPGGG